MSNVTNIDGAICCGCGVCAGVCPVGALEMMVSDEGGYRPKLAGTCTGCGICVKVCPFRIADSEKRALCDETFAGTKHIHPILGHYDDCYLGRVRNEEDLTRRASGGILTWLLEQLLKNGGIDAAWCAGATGHGRPLYRMVHCASPEDVRSCSGSVYYPVHFAEAIQWIIRNEGRYALVALPCTATAIRRAMALFPVLNERISHVLGLVCGHMKSMYFAEQLAAAAGVPFDKITELRFRTKRKDKACQRHESRLTWKAGDGELHSRQYDMGALFMNQSSTLWACVNCFEVFPQAADATFMDAWLLPYAAQWSGASIVVPRSHALRAYFADAAGQGECRLETIDAPKVLESQHAAVKKKLHINPIRSGRKVPFQVAAGDLPTMRMGCLDRLFYKYDARVCRRGAKLWEASGGRIKLFHLLRHLSDPICLLLRVLCKLNLILGRITHGRPS